jgi:hypothetical protein
MNKGVMVKNSDNSQPADTQDLKMLMDGYTIKADKYSELLTNYLKYNQTLFPKYYEYTITGISIPLLGMSCKTDGVINTYMDIKDAVARLYNYLMKSYLQPIWIVIENLLKALEAIVGGLFNIDLTLPVLNLTVSDLFSDNLYNRLITSITNLYNNALDQLKTILNVLGIPFKPYDDTDSPETTIASIVKNI